MQGTAGFVIGQVVVFFKAMCVHIHIYILLQLKIKIELSGKLNRKRKIWTYHQIECLVFVELPWPLESGHLLTKSLASHPSPDCTGDSAWDSLTLLFYFS